MLSLIVPKLKEGVGLYRDYGLAVMRLLNDVRKQNMKSTRYLKVTT